MKKVKIRVMGILTIIILLSIPLIVFKVQDYQNINKKIAWQNSSLDKELLQKYPIINDIYNEFFNNDSFQDNSVRYVIKNKDNYSVDEQARMIELQELFKQEVGLLLEKRVIDHNLLELSSQESFQVDFGTIIDKSPNSQGKYILDQIYRLNSENDNYANFSININSKKITSLSISNQLLTKLTKADLKKMAWQMIEYLGLEKIEDWTYTDYGYESYQAKLQIICEVSEFSQVYTLNIRVGMLGTSQNIIVN